MVLKTILELEGDSSSSLKLRCGICHSCKIFFRGWIEAAPGDQGCRDADRADSSNVGLWHLAVEQCLLAGVRRTPPIRARMSANTQSGQRVTKRETPKKRKPSPKPSELLREQSGLATRKGAQTCQSERKNGQAVYAAFGLTGAKVPGRNIPDYSRAHGGFDP